MKALHYYKIWTALAVLMAGTLASCDSETTSPTEAQVVYKLDEKPFGKTYAEWAEDWWRWVYATPAFTVSGGDTLETHPLLDSTGQFAGSGQSASSPVYFLGGKFNASGAFTRSVTIPSGKAILFPIINVCSDTVDVGPRTEESINVFFDSIFRVNIGEVFASLDGKEIANVRNQFVRTNIFSYTAGERNLYQLNGTDLKQGNVVAVAKSDGIWVMLTPLSKGTHVLKFKGTLPAFSFEQDMTYHITVN